MVPPSRYSASPFYSFVTRPADLSPPVTLAEACRSIWRWFIGGRRPVPLKRQIADAKLVAEIAAEIEAESAPVEDRRKAAAERKQGRRRRLPRVATVYEAELSEDGDV